MKQEIINTLEVMGFVRAGKHRLDEMSLEEIMKYFILPKCVCLPRSGVRYPRISGEFMGLMALYGEDFLQADYELGSVLLELAMQRLSRHPELPAIDYKGNLPEEYKPYSAASINPNGINGCPDEPGLWGAEAWSFIRKQLPTCLKLTEPRYSAHAMMLLYQIASRSAKSMSPYNSDVDDEEIAEWAVGLIKEYSSLDEFAVYLVKGNKGWREHAKFLSKYYKELNWERLFSLMDLDKEVYYKGGKRWVLKKLGLYDKLTKKRIARELDWE